MNIKIYYCYFLDFVSVSWFGVSSCHGNCVHVAEAAGLFLITLIVFESWTKNSCVMTRRSHGTESIPNFTFDNFINGFYTGATSKKSCFERLGWDDGVPIISFPYDFFIFILALFLNFFAYLLDCRDISIIMYFKNVCYSCRFSHLFDNDSRVLSEFFSLGDGAFVFIYKDH